MKKLCTFILILCYGILSAKDLFVPGEKVAFLGDSITYAGNFIGDLRMFSALSGEKETFFYNLGIPGDTCPMGLARVERELLPLKPDVVFIMFAMNDLEGWRFAKERSKEQTAIGKAAEKFRKNFTQLINTVQKHNIRIVLLTPTPYDEYGDQKGTLWRDYNEQGLSGAAEFIRKFAKERNIPCIDLFAPMTAHLKQFPKERLCGNDRIHPGSKGHQMIASIIWRGAKKSPVPKINAGNPIVRKARKLRQTESRLREADWMHEVAIRRGGKPEDTASMDAAFERELEARKGQRSFATYEKMIQRYKDVRTTRSSIEKQFKKDCSALFQSPK